MTINVSSGSRNYVERVLSNLSRSEFYLGGYCFQSVEGLLQGIKFPPDEPIRYEAFRLSGLPAKKLSEKAKNKSVWLLDGREVPYGCEKHQELLKIAIEAKFKQNPDLMQVLVSTGDEPIIHELGLPENPKTSLPKEQFCQILMDIRAEAQRKS